MVCYKRKPKQGGTMRTEQIHTRIDEGMGDRLKKAAERLTISKAEFVRRALLFAVMTHDESLTLDVSQPGVDHLVKVPRYVYPFASWPRLTLDRNVANQASLP